MPDQRRPSGFPPTLNIIDSSGAYFKHGPPNRIGLAHVFHVGYGRGMHTILRSEQARYCNRPYPMYSYYTSNWQKENSVNRPILPTNLRTIFQRIAQGLDLTRKVILNLVFFAFLLGCISWMCTGLPEVADKTALVLVPKGNIVEQLTVDPELYLNPKPGSETLVRDLLLALDHARDDPRVGVVLLNLSSFDRAGLPILQALRNAMASLRANNKKVIAFADSYNTYSYYLASGASQVYMHPLGTVLIEGFGRLKTYYKDGLDRLEIEPNVIRVGEFKSAVEPYLRNNMSDEARTANQAWLGDLWQAYLTDITSARGLEPQALQQSIDKVDQLLEQTGGDQAKLSLQLKLVDELLTREQVRKKMIALVGEDEESNTFHQISFQDYLLAEDIDTSLPRERANMIAVIVAKGTILEGDQPSGTIGADSISALIRKARKDENVKAIVLRVDSPGGSAFGSEIIRDECLEAKKQGLPVVISMGTLAASGGYWISTASDEIWANPNTITGSIGIFGLLPTIEKALTKHLGMTTDGVATTWLYQAYRPDRKVSTRFKAMVRQMIDFGYQQFLVRVAEARKMTPEQVNKIARGRVWSGRDALEIGLVDKLGDLEQAIQSAAKLARVESDFGVKYYEKEIPLLYQIANELLVTTGLGKLFQRHSNLGLVQQISDKLALLGDLDPGGIYAHCLCRYR